MPTQQDRINSGQYLVNRLGMDREGLAREGEYFASGNTFKQPLTNLLQNFGATGLANLTGFGGVGLPIGLTNLLDILAKNGRTSPDLLNQQLGSISRGTQSAQDAARSSLARGNLQNSGVGASLQAAIGQAGQNQRSAAISDENRLSEDRRRGDLGLLLDLLINPSLQSAGVGADSLQADKDRAQQREAAYLNAIAGIVPG